MIGLERVQRDMNLV